MRDVSTVRLYLLRAAYLLIAVGLGVQIWPLILQGSHGVDHMRGVVRSLLGAVGLLAVVGVRYPLKMLPLLLFELIWKSIWVLAIGVPLWRSHSLDAAMSDTWNDCLFGIILVILVLPWRYVVAQYALLPGDRWTRSGVSAGQSALLKGSERRAGVASSQPSARVNTDTERESGHRGSPW